MKIILRKIPIKQLKPYIHKAWDGDDELLKNAHKEHASMDDCIQVNLDTIRQASLDSQIDCYAVVTQDEEGLGTGAIGFTVIMHSQGHVILYSFGISLQYRTMDILTAWLVAIQEKVGHKQYIVSLYKVNSRAIRFFERNGFGNKTETETHVILWQ